MGTFDLWHVLVDVDGLRDFCDDDNYSDVDALFAQLEVIEPPSDMVERVMDAVMHLPRSEDDTNDGEDRTLLHVI
jgi:hypothetical protein